jgi:nascent polypeptide-associated complex subunit beta
LFVTFHRRTPALSLPLPSAGISDPRPPPLMDPVKLAKLQAQAAANRLGGKGTMRRKVVRKTKPSAAQDDKKLQAALKKLNVQPIPGVEEVNMFREDGNVLHFTTPKVHAAVSANTFAIYGAGHVKELTELVPGILNQLGPDSLASLRKLAESYQAIQQGQQRPAAGDDAENDDDDVPDLVENFDVEGEQATAAAVADDKEKLDDVN